MLYKVLLVYLVTFLIKIVAYHYSSLAVILADVFHSIVDISLILILIIAAGISKKVADLQHPHGHGLVKNVASLAASVIFITTISLELFKEGIERILNPKSYENLEIALIAEILVFLLLLTTAIFLRSKKGTLNRTAMFETLNDSLSTLSAIFGILLISSGLSIFDGIMTMTIASLIAYNSIRLFIENTKFLLGFSPSEEFYQMVERAVKGVDGVDGVHGMLAIYTAENEIHLDLHVTVDGNKKVSETDLLSKKIIEKLKEDFPEIKHVSIHFCSSHGKRRKIY